MPRLTITSGALSGQQFSFSGAVVIGRGTYSDIRIDDATVSRRHAEIIPGPEGCWCIRDLGSANGTLFDGKPVRGDQLIDGSIDVVIGEVAATIAIADPRESTGTGERAFPQLIDRLELLAWITSLPARREDPALLIGQILDRMLGDFDGCQRIGLFVRRPGSSNLIRYASRNVPGVDDLASSAMLANACLRHVDGVAGGGAAIEPLGISDAPAGILAAPVILGGETLGVVVAESAHPDTWNPMDRSLAKGIASVLAGLVEAERGSHPDRRVAERDLLLARRVQQHFLPATSLRLPGYQVAESYVPARVVGGDHYDYFRFADDRIGLVIADVSGKAVSAALVMARFGMGVRLLASQASNPLDLLVTLNVLLLDELEPGMFVTAQIAALNPESGEIEIANAGHPAPLLRAVDGTVTALGLEPGAPLGANAQTLFVANRITLGAGACLMLYSDGLDEAENAAGAQFGIERACAILARNPDAPSVLAEINRELAAFVGSAAPADDLTLLLLSRNRSQ
ncbi:SpoIIE family protein phosphatase [Dokdonella sp.]|uniref:SpoIIE family protein phosphatase n=1 Tax=Dokdonella sp. TaxID=2291710 RepID=UPI002CBC62BF|nr:SpoIIE family protein phosphatase [Dokdonella sp.]HOX70566.1 SpoIIE family protein phosphatase [Dokdonella sp.]HPN80338.1 SpoIIE family protein phosphatase [Dokdonella sp.]